MTKVIVPYEFNPKDLQIVDLAVVGESAQPEDGDWVPAFRDTIDGNRVVWARFPEPGSRMTVWIRDRSGPRRISYVT
jgi:hypothetical protein